MMCFLSFHSSRMELFLHNLQRVEFMAKIYSWPELNSVLEEALFAMALVAWSVAYRIWRSKLALVSSVMKIAKFGRKIWVSFRSLLPKVLPKFITGNSSEVYYRKFLRSLPPIQNSKAPGGLQKRDIWSNGYKFLTECYIPNQPSSRSDG